MESMKKEFKRKLEDKNVQSHLTDISKEKKNVKEWERKIVLKCITVNSFPNCSKINPQFQETE